MTGGNHETYIASIEFAYTVYGSGYNTYETYSEYIPFESTISKPPQSTGESEISNWVI